ncbi:MAG: hypothetical protein AAF940_04255 [Pseudomonadota bacterium]
MMQGRSAFRPICFVKSYFAALLVALTFAQPSPAFAYSMEAREALRLMDRDEFIAYTTGIIEGLIYARYVHDGRVGDKGARCIAIWFYRGDNVLETIRLAFHKFNDHTPRSIVGAMVETACPLN